MLSSILYSSLSEPQLCPHIWQALRANDQVLRTHTLRLRLDIVVHDGMRQNELDLGAREEATGARVSSTAKQNCPRNISSFFRMYMKIGEGGHIRHSDEVVVKACPPFASTKRHGSNDWASG